MAPVTSGTTLATVAVGIPGATTAGSTRTEPSIRVGRVSAVAKTKRNKQITWSEVKILRPGGTIDIPRQQRSRP